MGCDASNEESVKKIKELKYLAPKGVPPAQTASVDTDKVGNAEKPMSVIAPSVEWIKEHCEVSDERIEKYLPGPYTLILKKKDKDFMKDVAPADTLGVRIPDCEFTELVEKAGVPFITTSVNFAGEPFAMKISDIDSKILDAAEIVIGVGELDGRPSTLIIDGKEVKR